jgi:hypothetical protein
MTAVPELGVAGPAVAYHPGSGPTTAYRRLVAVAVSPLELLRPGSDLARLLEHGDESDLLLACEDVPARGSGSALGRLARRDAAAAAEPLGEAFGLDDLDVDDLDGVDDDDLDDDPCADEVRATAALLDLGDLQLHRLGLRSPVGPAAEADLVAALSELVGFDPEPGVYCLAPAPAPGDPARTVVARAAERIAQVYGLPLLRYRCLELSVVGDPC